MRTSAALTAAICVPLLLALAWLPRDTPPPWPCLTPMPAGQGTAIAEWRACLGPALVAAVLVLAGLACRVSAHRRQACGAARRPGSPTLTAAAVMVAGAVTVAASDTGLDGLAASVLLLFVLAPVTILVALSSLAWIAWAPIGAKGAAAAQIGIWTCVFATFLVVACIANAGLEQWCLD